MSETGTQAPEAVWSGRASIYPAPDGGYILAWQADGSEDTQHHHIPGMLVSMAERMQGSGEGVLGMLKGMMRRGS